MEKPLILSMRSLSGSSAEVEMVYGGRMLGHLELLSEDLGEFVEALREGFQVVIAHRDKRQTDIQSFVDELDEEDD